METGIFKSVKTKFIYFSAGILTGAVVLFLFGYTKLDKAIVQETEFPQGYKIISPVLPDDPEFAGEEVPVENFEVKERIDREFLVNTYWHSFTMLSMKRAGRWFPVIEEILDENNIPEDFKYLSVIESGLANAVSPAGATGFWQFMEASAVKYGLEVNDNVDERYHVEKSTEAACKYLNEAYDKFGSWTIAAASYNMGMNGMGKQLARQKTRNYYNLVLSEETSRYIARIIALKAIMENPEDYGFSLDDDDLYSELDIYDIEVNYPVHDLADWAINKGINYKILKMYNPWLRDISLINKNRKTYLIKMPEKGSINIISDNHN